MSGPRTGRLAPTGALAGVLACALAGAVSAAAALRAQARGPAATVVAFTHVTVVDVARGRLRPDMTVVVDGPRIATVGAAARTRVPPGARVVDGRGRFLLPGLWDMHVHFMNTGVSALPLLVANGVTSVREMGGYIADTREWQARTAAGTLVGPRIKTSGPVLESPRYLARVRARSERLGGQLAPLILPYRIPVATAADAERAVDSLVRLRVDFVKIRTADSPEAYRAILAAARRAGLTVAGHPPGVVSLREASDLGQRSVEHPLAPFATGLDSAARAELYAAWAANGTWYDPTLVVLTASRAISDSAIVATLDDSTGAGDPRRRYASRSLTHWWRVQMEERALDTTGRAGAAWRVEYHADVEMLRALKAAGVPILVGTDAGSLMVYPGFSVHEEMALLVRDAGLSPRDVLWGATLGPARFFQMERELGTVEVGKLADLVLLDADPLADIRNTAKIRAVVLRGRLFDEAARRRLLEDVAERAREPFSPPGR